MTTYAKAPTVKLSLYDEMSPTLYMSRLVFSITEIIKMSISGDLDLDIPQDFPVKNLERFLHETIDMTEYHNGNGMSFYEIDLLVKRNKDKLMKAFAKEAAFLQTIVHRIREDLSSCEGVDGDPMKHVYLTFHRSIQRNHACVYCVIKDTLNKRIIACFRGSKTEMDWKTNLDARVVGLDTPQKIENKMKGILKKRVLVHRGFRNYLFENDKMEDKKQRYHSLIGDIRTAVNKEQGYNIYVSGHSLGGALATMFTLKLAGETHDDIPRPITCISYGAPFSGTQGYRTAMEHLEHSKLIRHLRVVNGDDLIPTIPSVSLLRGRAMKHTGIQLRLNKSGYLLEHSSKANFMTAWRNNIFKSARFHPLNFTEDRLEQNAKQLRNLKLDELYKDKKYVSNDFINGKI